MYVSLLSHTVHPIIAITVLLGIANIESSLSYFYYNWSLLGYILVPTVRDLPILAVLLVMTNPCLGAIVCVSQELL